jgi:hypothetical protein
MMMEVFRAVMEGVLARLQYHVTTYVPSLVVALTLVLGAFLAAVIVRWALYKIFKGLTIDRLLRTSGIAYLLDHSGRLRGTRLVAETAYWLILLAGVLSGLSVFDTDLTTRMIQGFVFLIPKLLVAGLVLLAGAWLSQFLGRSLLVWAVSEELPSPRRWATLGRVLIMFVAVVVAADQLDFAADVFLAAFIILVGGAVLTASLALGLDARSGINKLKRREDHAPVTEDERSLWSHL